MLYYYDGVPSWSWYYPYHYAPFVHDIIEYIEGWLENSSGQGNIDVESPFKFELGKPFTPVQQLLAVLPAGSVSLLPLPYQRLMLDIDSKLKHFYPAVFKVDREGEKAAWAGVTLLPFINENLLTTCVREIEETSGLKISTSANTKGNVMIYKNIKGMKTAMGLTERVLRDFDGEDIYEQNLVHPIFISSTMPTILPPLSIPGVIVCTLSSEFDFKEIQRGRTHQSTITLTQYPSCHPTFRITGEGDRQEWGQGVSLLDAVIGSQSHVRSLEYMAKSVRIFGTFSRNHSVCMNLSTSSRSLPQHRHVFDFLQRFVSLLQTSIDMPDGPHCSSLLDFSFLPAVRGPYPFRY